MEHSGWGTIRPGGQSATGYEGQHTIRTGGQSTMGPEGRYTIVPVGHPKLVTLKCARFNQNK